MIRLDLTGMRFERLTVVQFAGFDSSKRPRPQWQCKCNCGGSHVTTTSALRSGHVKSCGCLLIESAKRASEAHRSHGLTGSRLERIWKGMNARCRNPNHPAFVTYGGAGIDICEEWLERRASFFEWAFATGYQEMLSIDRIDNTKGYSPDNCRWTTAKVQANNTKRNRIIEHNGERLNLSQWAERTGVPIKTIWYRLSAGWDFERAITKKVTI